ncbi:MAG: cyclic nucleotide-binding domain-containing protein [Desulfovibrio sp.]|jgi:CRP-like cAMP-binding protein|nr:cyclic nucleotide-binding domain-containing protein [Desulfovibrio sp.]
MLEKEFDPKNAEMLEQLRRVPAFAPLEERQIEAVMKLSRLRRYEPGEIITHEGEYDGWVFFLIQGELSITHKGVQVGTVRRLGDVFGEMGVVDGSPRSATITALKPSLCIALDASIFERLEGADRCAVRALLYKVFCEIMAVRLREMDAKLAELSRRCNIIP